MSEYADPSSLAATLLFLLVLPTTGAEVNRALIRDGRTAAIIVVGSTHPERARAAADELNEHLVRATGVGLPVVDEASDWEAPDDRTVVVVGGGEMAASLGLPQTPLAVEEYAIRTVGHHVVFLGSDTTGVEDPDERRQSPATLWAVDHFLDRHMGVRWLWPGQVGTFAPKTETVTVPDIDARERPAMVVRSLRRILWSSHVQRARVTNLDVFGRVADEADQWYARHQMGRREKLAAGHSFRHWWETYHEQHPDIFAKLPEGMTQPNPMPDRVKLCIANPKVAQLALTEWREAGRPDIWPIGPNDGQGYCVCGKCRALDVPDTLDADPLDIFWNRSVVNLAGRYLDLWRRLLAVMRRENPEVMLTTLAYANYRTAAADMKPLGHRNALAISWVPDDWSDAERQSFLAWRNTIGAGVVLRPNWWHVGHAAPYLPLHGPAEFVRFAQEQGLVGISFDSLLGYWGTQGPNYYLIARLSSRPDLTPEQALDEYSSAFGNAAPVIRQYLAYWDRVTTEAQYPDWAGHFREPGGWYERTLSAKGLQTNPFWGSWSILPFLYTDARLADGRRILDRAEQRVKPEDAMVRRRIEFLRDGLRHLELSRDVVELADAKIRPKAEGVAALREQEERFKRLVVRLKCLRSDLTKRHVVWGDVIAWHEQWRKVKLGDRYSDPWSVCVVPDGGWGQWRFRKDPDEAGVQQEWFAEAIPEPDEWRAIKVPAFWDKTDVGPYQGTAWYRTTFRMPETWEHTTVDLTFGAVDEQAWVYLNGQLVGEHTIASEGRDIEGFSIGDLWDVPFTISVPTDQVRLKRENTLVVRVHNEIGAGGIWGGVFVQPPRQPFFADLEELGDGIRWEPDKSYTSFRMARMGSGQVVVTVGDTSHGIIMEGGADGGGWALYVHDGHLFFQCGKGNAFRAAHQAVIRVPIQPGKHTIEWSVDATRHRAALRIDGGDIVWSDAPIYTCISGNDPGGIGRIHGGGVCRNAAGWTKGEAGNFTGTIHSATVWPDKVRF